MNITSEFGTSNLNLHVQHKFASINFHYQDASPKTRIAMTDPQRIHPDTYSRFKPTAPLMGPGPSSASQKGYPFQHPPAPLPRAVPLIFSSQPRSTTWCCRCFCWTISLIIILLILIGVAIGAIFLVFNPKLPQYSVDSLRITDLRLNLDLTLYARFDVKITANNPNEKIGIYYEKGGSVSVWFQGTSLCDGPLPKFYQGHRNVTRLGVTLTGQRESGSTIMSALQLQQQAGNIPLDLHVHAPVRIELGTWKLRKIWILGECSLVVDSLSTNSMISINASDCKFRSKL
ncbi:hypothetical protein SAY86_015403 [Trapa natans]|uniref:Late embryogenesis abundant protein LEA-2 subgroup domain-containing protein n=1 Tax=Trapa natans TaxID=22666 RepID=A0AAN7KEN3_TRANT|nr:hypothetical protein SAY86_015403 [Trapa natans]